VTTSASPRRSFQETLDRLCASSRRNVRNPSDEIPWPEELPTDTWCTSPELLSVYGTDIWDGLDEAQQRRLSFWEAVNFYSLNIHGEKALMQGLAARLYRRDMADVTPYLHHMLDEENKHSVYFGGFCRRYAGKVYPSRKLAMAREYAPGEETFLFFAMVLIFEETVDRFNVMMARDERLAPVARAINASHHDDEARHLIFGRRMVARLWERSNDGWDGDVVAGVRTHLDGYFAAMWRDYYNPAVYADAGLDEARALPSRLWDAPAQRDLRVRMSSRAISLLTDMGVLAKAPSL
jgi:hypothetical protein